jgi:tRNA (uracil-5-)-methyltransferase
VGIEINNKAIDEATANAQLNGIENCAFIAASAEAIFESDADVRLPSQDKEMNGGDDSSDQEGELGMAQKVRNFPRGQTVVVLDPPRKGCSEEFLEQLYAFGPQRIVYMSCDPATQARDSRGIVDHGYKVVSVQPFDLFPQTRHIECLMVFEKINE